MRCLGSNYNVTDIDGMKYMELCHSNMRRNNKRKTCRIRYSALHPYLLLLSINIKSCVPKY